MNQRVGYKHVYTLKLLVLVQATHMQYLKNPTLHPLFVTYKFPLNCPSSSPTRQRVPYPEDPKISSFHLPPFITLF